MKKSEKKRKAVQKIVKRNRKNTPKQYNQIELGDYLLDPNIDWLISISNRTDGKTFNYLNLLIDIAIEEKVKFLLICRHNFLRDSYIDSITTIVQTFNNKELDELVWFKNKEYLQMFYGEEPICIITDLNNATDLKYSSHMLMEYPIIVYDEFLALEEDYNPTEFDQLKTIFESVNRDKEEDREVLSPQIMLLGNAVNFSSPILAGLDGIMNLYAKMENHPINSLQVYDFIAYEMRKNESANDTRNLRAFGSQDDSMTTGQFVMNNHNILSSTEQNKILENGYFFHIKVNDSMYIKVIHDKYMEDILLKLTSRSDSYEFCLSPKDMKEEVIYCDPRYYFGEVEPKNHASGFYTYANNFTKNTIANDNILNTLKISRCVSEYLEEIPSNQVPDNREKIVLDNYMEKTLKSIHDRFWQEY